MRYVLAIFILLGSLGVSDAQTLSPYQRTVLDFYYAQAQTNSIDGAWIIDGTVPIEKLSTNLQQTILLPFNIEVVTTDKTLDRWDRTILVDTTAGDIDITLLGSSIVTGQYYEVKMISGTNECNVVPVGVETIDGDTGAFRLYLHESISIQSDGGINWYIL